MPLEIIPLTYPSQTVLHIHPALLLLSSFHCAHLLWSIFMVGRCPSAGSPCSSSFQGSPVPHSYCALEVGPLPPALSFELPAVVIFLPLPSTHQLPLCLSDLRHHSPSKARLIASLYQVAHLTTELLTHQIKSLSIPSLSWPYLPFPKIPNPLFFFKGSTLGPGTC